MKYGLFLQGFSQQFNKFTLKTVYQFFQKASQITQYLNVYAKS